MGGAALGRISLGVAGQPGGVGPEQKQCGGVASESRCAPHRDMWRNRTSMSNVERCMDGVLRRVARHRCVSVLRSHIATGDVIGPESAGIGKAETASVAHASARNMHECSPSVTHNSAQGPAPYCPAPVQTALLLARARLW